MKTFRVGVGDSVSLLLRIAFVGFFLLITLALTYWQAGALRNSWEAQLSARAATLVNAPWSRSIYPEPNSPDLAEISSPSSMPTTWRSPNFPPNLTSLLPSPPLPEPGKLFKPDSPALSGFWGITLLIPQPDGTSIRTTYLAPISAFTAQWLRLGAINALFFLLPAIFLAAIWSPAIRRSAPTRT